MYKKLNFLLKLHVIQESVIYLSSRLQYKKIQNKASQPIF